MPGLSTTVTAFTTPGIASLLKKRPDIVRRVARAHLVSVLRVKSGAKRLSPVDTGRLKLSLTERQLDTDALIHVVGTNVVARRYAMLKTKRARKRYRRASRNWRWMTPRGYSYPARMEHDTKITHTTGEWGYLRKPLTAEAKKHADQCLRALVRGLKGYE